MCRHSVHKYLNKDAFESFICLLMFVGCFQSLCFVFSWTKDFTKTTTKNGNDVSSQVVLLQRLWLTIEIMAFSEVGLCWNIFTYISREKLCDSFVENLVTWTAQQRIFFPVPKGKTTIVRTGKPSRWDLAKQAWYVYISGWNLSIRNVSFFCCLI